MLSVSRKNIDELLTKKSGKKIDRSQEEDKEI